MSVLIYFILFFLQIIIIKKQKSYMQKMIGLKHISTILFLTSQIVAVA